MKFCSQCGKPVTLKMPEGDTFQRHVCDHCETIHYLNPRIIAGCLPTWGNKVLLCRRAIEPRREFWTLPAGFMENKETTADAATRETLEEANARVANARLYTMFNLPHISQVYMFFLAELADLNFSAGLESLDVSLFEEHEVPWDELAFPVVTEALKLFFEDYKQQVFGTYTADIVRSPEGWTSYEVQNFIRS